MFEIKDLSPVLVLSPHLDDAALAMCGTLDELSVVHPKHNRIFFYSGCDHPGLDPQKQIQYWKETKLFLDSVKCRASFTKNPSINSLAITAPIVDYINELTDFVNSHKPNSIFIPATDYNSDHRFVYDIASTVIRPHDKNHYIPNVLLYEQMCTQQAPLHSTFMPSFFVPINIDEKLKLWSLFETQQRSYRSPEQIKAVAKLRGSQSNWPYAEAFQAVRMTAWP